MNEGIKLNPNRTFSFNYTNDGPDDVVHLKVMNRLKKLNTRYGVSIFFAYMRNKKAKSEQWHKVEQSLKQMDTSLIDERDFEQMVDKAIVAFNKLQPISEFDIILTPESSSPLNTYLAERLAAKAGNVPVVSSAFIKSAIEDIEIRPDIAQKYGPEDTQKLKNNIISRAARDGKFQMKKLPPNLRTTIIKFLKMSDLSRESLNLINEGKVLVVDDIYTGGNTMREMNRQLSEIGADEIVDFVLLSGG